MRQTAHAQVAVHPDVPPTCSEKVAATQEARWFLVGTKVRSMQPAGLFLPTVAQQENETDEMTRLAVAPAHENG